MVAMVGILLLGSIDNGCTVRDWGASDHEGRGPTRHVGRVRWRTVVVTSG